mgnify:CR=1 FL=1
MNFAHVTDFIATFLRIANKRATLEINGRNSRQNDIHFEY